MSDIEWKTMAMLAGRKLRTRRLASCLRDFLSLPDAQRLVARVVIPDCIRLGRGGATRTVSGSALAALAGRLPVHERLNAR